MVLLLSKGVAAIAPMDPCASSANPELCHYDQAKALLAQMSPSQSPSQEALVQVDERVRTVSNSDTQDVATSDTTNDAALNAALAKSGSVSTSGSTVSAGSADLDGHLDSTQDGSSPGGEATSAGLDVDHAQDGGNSPDHEALELKTMVLKQALDVLEGEAPAPPSLEKVTMQLEEGLEDIEPGALATFRSEHLAGTMNADRPPPSANLRATVAAHTLSAADWENDDEVVAAIEKLDQVGNHGSKSIPESTYLCSKKSCGAMGCSHASDPSNAECDVTSEKKCADGHGVCRRGRGKVLKTKFKIEIMADPGSFLYMPEWGEKVEAISALKHKRGEPGPDGLWYVVLNSDSTIMMYTEKFGPDYWLSIEEHAGKKVLAYRGFTSPVACSFTVHTNKEEDQVYLRDVPFHYFITDSGDGEFKPDPFLDKKAANLKFHPRLPSEVEMIADSAYSMSLGSLLLVYALLNF